MIGASETQVVANEDGWCLKQPVASNFFILHKIEFGLLLMLKLWLNCENPSCDTRNAFRTTPDSEHTTSRVASASARSSAAS